MAVNATDNLLIAKMLGLALVGVYANYQMVFNSAQTLIALLFSAMLPSVGNLGIRGDRRRMTETFRRAEFAGFYLTAVMAACLLSLVNPFVAWWVGEAYLLPEGTLLALLANFYLKQMRLPLLTFRDATGSYRRDRFKPVAEAAVNLIASIWLVRRYGLAGVFLGTIAGTVAVALVVEPVIVHRACLDTPLGRYYLRLFLYTLLLSATCAAARWAGGLVPAYTLFGLLLRGTLVFAMANACLLPALWFTREGRFIRALLMRALRALRRSAAVRRA